MAKSFPLYHNQIGSTVKVYYLNLDSLVLVMPKGSLKIVKSFQRYSQWPTGVNDEKIKVLLCSLNFTVLRLEEISRGHLAHPSSSREDCHSVMHNRRDIHLFFTSLGKAVPQQHKPDLLDFSHNKKIFWPVVVSQALGNSCGDLGHCTGRLKESWISPAFDNYYI